MPKRIAVGPETASGDAWARLWDLVIYDPDGWHRGPPEAGYCSLQDEISEHEFWERVIVSTCKFSQKARERLGQFYPQVEDEPEVLPIVTRKSPEGSVEAESAWLRVLHRDGCIPLTMKDAFLMGYREAVNPGG